MASLHPPARRFGARPAARTTSSRRLPTFIVLLVLLVVATVGAGPVLALSTTGAAAPVPSFVAASGLVATAPGTRSAASQAALIAANDSALLQAAAVRPSSRATPAKVVKHDVPRQTPQRATSRRASTQASSPRQSSTTRTTRTTSTTTRVSSPTYRYSGTNHVWIPSLGISRAVYWFPCSRTTDPGPVVYRWGCAGTNNVYLMAHASGPFYALNQAYYNGRLRVGLKVVYANSSGRVHTYSVIWWRVVRPTTAASWAWAALSRPSMTLQTCLGANSQYRLMVRLIQIS